MKYLIDTQILIWFQLNDPKLKPSLRALLRSPDNEIYVSEVSLFEIAIKKTIGKLPELIATLDDIIEVAQKDGFYLLPMSQSYILSYEDIPYIETHRDPFDRLLLATALVENIPLISADEKFDNYSNLISVY